MATLHLDNLPPELLTQIEQLANQNQCSVDQQAISLLQNALKIQYSQHTTAPTQSITDILEESRHQREKLPKNIQWLDSTELIREDRERGLIRKHCVLDASVCIKHFIPDPFSHKVDTLLTHLAHPQTDIYVPDLFYIEMANILWKYFRAGQITDSKIRNDLATLKANDLRITSTAELMEEAISIAILYDISAYDASYVALSQRVQAPLLTLDNKLLKALVASSFNIVSFADFTLPPI